MPRIIVMADNPTDDTPEVMFTERVSASDFESTHFRHQLVERLQWAVGDAHVTESARHQSRPQPHPEARPRTARPDRQRDAVPV